MSTPSRFFFSRHTRLFCRDNHGKEVPESKYIWMAFLGPDTPALGERSQIPAVTQSQIAATLAAIVDENYHAAVPKAGKPISDVLSR